MMRHSVTYLIALIVAFALSANSTQAEDSGLELISVEKIWDAAPHNAFTDLVRYKDKWVCGFREAPAHKGGVKDSRIRIIVSDDGKSWESAGTISDEPRGDIRDAKFGVMPDGRLMVLTATQLFDTSEKKHQSHAWFTSDLKTWDGPHDVADADIWAWGINFHKGVGYSIGYRTVKPQFVRLYSTKDGKTFDTHVENLQVENGYPNESVIVFDKDDTAYCLLRCSGPSQFGVAKPPYKDWNWTVTGTPIGGPEMVQLPDGRFLGGGRLYDGGARTSLFWIDPQTAKVTEALKLPSGGDTSYPGFILHDGVLHVSYYSSHEGKSSIYFAKVKIKEADSTEKVSAVAEPVDIANRLEPFIDDYLIEKIDGAAQLLLHKPQDREIVITHDKPWEGNTSTYHTVFYDGEKYRMYYRGHHAEGYGGGAIKDHPQFVCYAESDDGIHWTKPNLGIIEFNGSKDNNIIRAEEPGLHNFAPFHDTNPNAKPDEKYKAVGSHGRGLFVFKSADAIHWEVMHDKPVITDGAFDSLNIAFYDTYRKRYVDFHRHFRNGVRDIKTATSDDFINWTAPEWLEYTGAPPEHLYTNAIIAYHRAPHIFVGLPKRIVFGRNPAGHHYPGVSDCVFMTSRDGETFHRWREAIVRPGLQQSRWVNRNNLAAWGIVETKSTLPDMPNELSMYSTGDYYQGNGVTLRRHTWRLDGFVSVNALAAGGELQTKPVVFAAGEQARQVKVEDPELMPLPPSIVAIQSDAIFGSGAVEFRSPTTAAFPQTKSLGKQVTLAAHVKNVPAGRRRLFSSYNGGSTTPNELFIDFDSDGEISEDAAIRFGYNDIRVLAPSKAIDDWSKDDNTHHIAVTWNDGKVSIYFDGKRVGEGGKAGAGELVSTLGDIRFGEDIPPASLTNEPFIGLVDDIIVLHRALSDQEISKLAKDGAAKALNAKTERGIWYAMETAESPMTDLLLRDGQHDARYTNVAQTNEIERGATELMLNVSTSAIGSVKVELQDADGKPIPGYTLDECNPIYGDKIAMPVAWNGRTEVSKLAGKPIRIRMVMQDADVYAFQFKPNAGE